MTTTSRFRSAFAFWPVQLSFWIIAFLVTCVLFGACPEHAHAQTKMSAAPQTAPVVTESFARTDIDTLVPRYIVFTDRIERTDHTVVKSLLAGQNGLKQAFDLAEPGDTIGLTCTVPGIVFGDGKSQWYQDSVNRAGGMHDVNVLGLSADARILGTVVVRNNVAAVAGNHRLGFFRLRIEALPGAYACAQTFINSPPTFGLEFVEDDFWGEPAGHTYSHVRFQGPASFSFRDCIFRGTLAGGVKEHNIYADNWCGASEIVDCEFRSSGTGSVQIVNRIESGPPQQGNLLIQGNTFNTPGDAFAITVAGASDPFSKVMIYRNVINLTPGGYAGGILVYREGAVPTLHVPKLGSWPVGSTGSEGWSPTNLPDPTLPTVASVVLKQNRIEGNGIRKQLTCFGSVVNLRIEGGNRFISSNQPAIQINWQSAVQHIELALTARDFGLTWQAKSKIVDSTITSKPRVLSDAEVSTYLVPVTP